VIRQLQRLLRPVEGLAPGALGLAIYAHPQGETFAIRSAAEQGYEGVSCVDDAARAAILYTRIWQLDGAPWARTAAEGLLTFVCAMQVEGGAFLNFIADWDGRRQSDTATSHAHGGPWDARAMHALAVGVRAYGDQRYAKAFLRGLPAIDRATPYLDLRAVAALAALEYWRATDDPAVGARAVAWSEEIAATRMGDVLPDLAGRGAVHLWGHLQEAALAGVGSAFGRDDLVDLAERSAMALLVPPTRDAFEGARTLAFDVSCVVAGLDAVARATGQPHYAALADDARAWFDGRNTAHAPVYDRERGTMCDGIDDGVLNGNSGAESNIEGGLALVGSPRWDARARPAAHATA
jgi:hypothetical protein